ncbi:MAG: type II toxin-antitoxin system RelE/ParE family toxin [Candidatus Kapabacteria bacterium]|nr:type II toxin-antitoxin system RelE/ParE family toxin [Candidatus Kapabacteria bacterium]
MNYSVQTIDIFEKQAKKLNKKYPSLKLELKELVEHLKSNPDYGIALGGNCFKIRLSVKSKGKGKSGGLRIITYYKVINETIFLISIYDKSEINTIPIQTINSILTKIK